MLGVAEVIGLRLTRFPQVLKNYTDGREISVWHRHRKQGAGGACAPPLTCPSITLAKCDFGQDVFNFGHVPVE